MHNLCALLFLKYIVAHDLKGYIYNLDKLEESNYNVGENNLLNKIFKIIKATTDEERKSIAEGSEFLMDVVTQIRKFLYDEETKEMKNLQDKWKREAEKEGYAEGMEKGIEQGIEKGIEKNQIMTIKNMQKLNFNLESMQKITNLDKNTIENILKN